MNTVLGWRRLNNGATNEGKEEEIRSKGYIVPSAVYNVALFVGVKVSLRSIASCRVGRKVYGGRRLLASAALYNLLAKCQERGGEAGNDCKEVGVGGGGSVSSSESLVLELSSSMRGGKLLSSYGQLTAGMSGVTR